MAAIYESQGNLKRAAELGYTFYVGPELEYFYFKDAKGTEILDEGGYFDMTPHDAAHDLRRLDLRLYPGIGARDPRLELDSR